MYFCYPKASHKTIAGIVAALACQQFLPFTAWQLNHIVHSLADSHRQSKLSYDSSAIRLGSSVELKNLDTNERGWLQLVAPPQASYRRNRISILSPLGADLLGKTTDHDVQLTLLRHQLNLRVLTVMSITPNKIRSFHENP
ncbi:MAG TPA: GreA/GreB family elongation factor [Rheinheimera sp.]|nr:GreA/GreB family elongation factor [Rheinheimera sp.]